MAAVVGVDPSISSTGVAFVSPGGVGVVRVKSSNAGQELDDRLRRMRRQVLGVIDAVDVVEPALIVIEGPAFGKNNAQTHMLAGFWWLLVHGLQKVAPLAVVQPPTLKKFATGRGNAAKDEVLAAAVRGFPDIAVRGNDEADALALACMGAERFGLMHAGGFPAAGRGAVASVRWPELKGSGA